MMKYWEMFKEENEAVKERHELALERIGQFKTEETVAEPYRSYFRKAAEFIMLAEKVYGMQERGELEALSLDEAKKLNIKLYEDVLPGNYEESFCNPAFAVAALGRDFGQYLAFLLTEIRGMIVYAYESRLTDMTILEEVLIEVYNLFESEEPELKEVKEVLYYFVSDYCDVMLTYRVRETLDPSLDFAKSIIMDSDLTDLRYLYRFGEYISDSELKIAAFLNSLPEETVRKMADTYTEGIRKGFVASGRSYKSKKTVQIRYHIGFERMIRMAVENFRKLGLEPVISRAAVGTVNRAGRRGPTDIMERLPTGSMITITVTTMPSIWIRLSKRESCPYLRWRMRNAVLWQRLMRDRQSLRLLGKRDSHLRIKRRRLP